SDAVDRGLLGVSGYNDHRGVLHPAEWDVERDDGVRDRRGDRGDGAVAAVCGDQRELHRCVVLLRVGERGSYVPDLRERAERAEPEPDDVTGGDEVSCGVSG